MLERVPVGMEVLAHLQQIYLGQRRGTEMTKILEGQGWAETGQGNKLGKSKIELFKQVLQKLGISC